MKKKYYAIGFLILLLSLAGFLFIHPMFLKSNHITLDVNEKYDYKKNIGFVFFGNKDDVTINKKIDTSKISDYNIVYSYKKQKSKCKVSVEDMSPPVLKLRDYTTDTIEKVTVDTFIKQCEDVSPYKLTMKMKERKEGVYLVTVKAEDKYKNSVEKTCTFIQEKDKTCPKIEGFEENMSVLQGNSIDYETVDVKDDYDPKPSVEIKGQVDFGVPGTYTIDYTVKDRSGNSKKYQRTIRVEPNDEYNMKVVYLTFDDGPSYNTSKVLDILKKYNVKATFFVTGCGQNYNDMILRAYNEGHAIGLHTYTHDYASVYSSEEAYYNDLNTVGNMVKDIIGFKPNIIRFPGGASNTISANYKEGIMTTLVDSVIQHGYQYYDWNVSSGDAAGVNVDADTIVEAASSGSGQQLMVLFHDAAAKDTTVEALPKVIEYYKKQGYVFMPITKDKSMICHHSTNN